MNEQQVVDLMKSSKTEAEWIMNEDQVKSAHDGMHPVFWYPAIVLSGVMGKTAATFGRDDRVRVDEVGRV